LDSRVRIKYSFFSAIYTHTRKYGDASKIEGKRLTSKSAAPTPNHHLHNLHTDSSLTRSPALGFSTRIQSLYQTSDRARQRNNSTHQLAQDPHMLNKTANDA
jgi:hypothetical protein